MRGYLFLLSILAVAACADRGPAGESDASIVTTYGQDPIALRVARGGGMVRAYQYPRLDSLIWTSTQPIGAQARVLAFDPENGLEAYIDRNGVTGWVDLRVGSVKRGGEDRVVRALSTDAWSIYSVVRDTIVHRSTPSGEWEMRVAGGVHSVFPLKDGNLVLVALQGDEARLMRLRPPESKLSDSALVPAPTLAAMSPLGDRMYLSYGSELVALDARTFNEIARVRFDGDINALVTTPSGDRVFVASEGEPRIAILDRYSGEQTEGIAVPGPVRELRVDPLGRLLLARPDSGDSVWVVSIGTNRLVATLPTTWRDDLPTVAPDGSVATIPERDVHFTRPGQDKPRIIVTAGGGEIWHFVAWNGFRPRAPGLDKPVVFPEDSMVFGSPVPDLTPVAPSSPGVAPPATVLPPAVEEPPAPPATTRRDQFSVQVAALLSEERAREVAREVRVEGLQARVVTSTADGVRIYRVVLGPYATRAEADRAGRLSGKNYWVFEGVP